MSLSRLDRLVKPLVTKLQDGHMHRLGIANTMRLAHAYNRNKFRRQDEQRHRLYQNSMPELLKENGAPSRPAVTLQDGWALDTSLSLPHLDRVLEASDKIIAEQAGQRKSAKGAYRSFFQNMMTTELLGQHPAFLDFATSSEILQTVSNYIQCVPVLSATLPAGVRLVESNMEFDDQPDVPHDSQIYHIDYYSLPNVYVLVLLRDTTIENGPWTFLPKSVSKKTSDALGYWSRRRPYRLSDDEIYSVADKKDVISFAYPRGTVLFIESSGCFHYGSRRCVKPRFQLMYGYSGACRTDFSEVIMNSIVYPKSDSDSRLRKLVLDKHRLE